MSQENALPCKGCGQTGTCPRCEGEGKLSPKPCGECKGTIIPICNRCGGTGVCPSCGGSGWIIPHNHAWGQSPFSFLKKFQKPVYFRSEIHARSLYVYSWVCMESIPLPYGYPVRLYSSVNCSPCTLPCSVRLRFYYVHCPIGLTLYVPAGSRSTSQPHSASCSRKYIILGGYAVNSTTYYMLWPLPVWIS